MKSLAVRIRNAIINKTFCQMGILQSHLMQLCRERKCHTINLNYPLIHNIDISLHSTIKLKGKTDHSQNVVHKKGGVVLFQEYCDKSGEANSGKYEKHFQVLNQSGQRQ